MNQPNNVFQHFEQQHRASQSIFDGLAAQKPSHAVQVQSLHQLQLQGMRNTTGLGGLGLTNGIKVKQPTATFVI